MWKTTILKQISDFIGVTDAWLIQDINKDVKTVGHKVAPWCVKAGEILKDVIRWVTSLIVWTAVTFKPDVKNLILSLCLVLHQQQEKQWLCHLLVLLVSSKLQPLNT